MFVFNMVCSTSWRPRALIVFRSHKILFRSLEILFRSLVTILRRFLSVRGTQRTLVRRHVHFSQTLLFHFPAFSFILFLIFGIFKKSLYGLLVAFVGQSILHLPIFHIVLSYIYLLFSRNVQKLIKRGNVFEEQSEK